MSTPDSYADLEIRILEREDAGYPVEITLNLCRTASLIS